LLTKFIVYKIPDEKERGKPSFDAAINDPFQGAIYKGRAFKQSNVRARLQPSFAFPA
jgi:hypothetical protein